MYYGELSQSIKVLLIMLTGFGRQMKERDECPPGVDLILAKPVEPDELREAIQTALAAHPPGPA